MLPKISLGVNPSENNIPNLPKVSIGSLSNSLEEGSPIQFIIPTLNLTSSNISVHVKIQGSPSTLERSIQFQLLKILRIVAKRLNYRQSMIGNSLDAFGVLMKIKQSVMSGTRVF